MNERKIHIESINVYRDGGTVSVKTNLGEYCIDRRIGSDKNPHKNAIFSGYPNSLNQPVTGEDGKQLKRSLLSALKEFGLQSQQYSQWLPIFKEIKI